MSRIRIAMDVLIIVTLMAIGVIASIGFFGILLNIDNIVRFIYG